MEASTPVKPLDQAAPGANLRRRRAAEPDRDRRPEVRHQRPALLPQPPSRGLDVEAEGAQLLHRGAQLAARGRLVQDASSTPTARVRGEASPNYTAFPQHQGVPERMALGGPRREADLHGPRPARADRRALGPQLRQAAREGDAGRDPGAPEHLLRHPLASTRCSSSASSSTTRRSRSWSSSSPSFATSGWRRCAGCSSSSASTPTSTTRASSRSATRPRARRARPGSRCGWRRWAAAAAGGMFPSNFWLVLDDRLPLRRAIKRPDVRAALPPETLEELRADAERLRELTGRDFSNWKIWDPCSRDRDGRLRTKAAARPPRRLRRRARGRRDAQLLASRRSRWSIANVMQLVSVLVVAAFLGPSRDGALRAAASSSPAWSPRSPRCWSSRAPSAAPSAAATTTMTTTTTTSPRPRRRTRSAPGWSGRSSSG